MTLLTWCSKLSRACFSFNSASSSFTPTAKHRKIGGERKEVRGLRGQSGVGERILGRPDAFKCYVGRSHSSHSQNHHDAAEAEKGVGRPAGDPGRHGAAHPPGQGNLGQHV